MELPKGKRGLETTSFFFEGSFSLYFTFAKEKKEGYRELMPLSAEVRTQNQEKGSNNIIMNSISLSII